MTLSDGRRPRSAARMRFARIVGWGLGAALLTMVAASHAGAAELCPKALPSDATTTRIYMSTDGSDKNSGSPRKPVKSLMAAYRIARESPAARVEVLVEPGTYFGQAVEWTEPMNRETRFATFLGPRLPPQRRARGL